MLLIIAMLTLTCGSIISSEHQIFTGKNEIFEQFKDNVFTDDEYNHFQITHPAGRESLLNHRLGEIFSQNSFNSSVKYFSTNPNLSLINSSCLYHDIISPCYFSSNRDYKFKETNPLRIFVENIAALEFFLNEKSTKQIELVQSTEKMRVHDLFLLTAMLTNVCHQYVENPSADVLSLHEIAYASHHLWPPLNNAGFVNHTSAYTVIKAALERRKEKNLDDMDTHNYVHSWNYTFSVDDNDEKKHTTNHVR
ncbi:hypothetical protein Noda2021_01590 [Candidatus Dependentiae bacterium Noda2021]|nr:hypothetical protein Noda2021_01590 [Candidatus Dependentiae bacterium Noda2021]